MTNPSSNENADRAIREALESVERIERERKQRETSQEATQDATVFDPSLDASAEAVEILPPSEDPPSGDPSTTVPPKKTAQDAMIEALLKAKQESAEVLAQTQKEAKDLFDRLARVSADFDNFKKREKREREESIKFGNEKLLREMLPVLDNLLRALTASGDGSQVVEGVRLVVKQFEDALQRVGVVGYGSLREPFDPARHEAVGARPDADVPAQHVVEEFQRGYFLHERLLRPALVIVSSGPPSAPAPEDG